MWRSWFWKWGLGLLLVGLIAASAQARSARPSPADNPEEPPFRIRSVWILGDSLTLGVYASSQETTFRNALFHDLQSISRPWSMRITLWESVCTLGGLEEEWDDLPGEPTLLFIEVGINDILGNENCPLVPEAQWRQRYGAMLDRIQQDAPGVEIIVGSIPWSNWPEESDRYRKALQYNQWIAEEAQARAIPVADLWSATLGRKDGISTPDQPSMFPPYHGDNFHPNDVGHRRIANTFFQTYLRKYQRLYTPFQLSSATKENLNGLSTR